MMTNDDVKRTVREWASEIGLKEAFRRLVNAEIAGAIVQKLLNGTYVSNLSFDKAQAILAEMEKDGFPRKKGRAS